MNINYITEGIGGLLFVVSVINLVFIYFRSMWTKVEGKVVVSRISPVYTLDFLLAGDFVGNRMPLSYNDMGKPKHKPSYMPKLAYVYTTSEQAYIGTRMYSAPVNTFDIGDMRFFTEGGKYPVWYNPKNHSQSYLIKSSKIPSILIFLVGGILIWVGIYGVTEFYTLLKGVM